MRIGRIEDMAQHLLRLRGEVIDRFFPETGLVLEIGSGEAVFHSKNCELIKLNITRRGDPTVLGDGEALPFQSETFDAVIATEVIEHVRYPYRLLREIRRVVRPEGRALLSTPNVAIPVNRVALAVFGLFPDDRTLHDGVDVGHIHFFTRRSLLEALASEGFEITKEWDFLLQVLPSRYLYSTRLERWFRNYAKQIIVSCRVRRTSSTS